jgi:hypothetical protein
MENCFVVVVLNCNFDCRLVLFLYYAEDVDRPDFNQQHELKMLATLPRSLFKHKDSAINLPPSPHPSPHSIPDPLLKIAHTSINTGPTQLHNKLLLPLTMHEFNHVLKQFGVVDVTGWF